MIGLLTVKRFRIFLCILCMLFIRRIAAQNIHNEKRYIDSLTSVVSSHCGDSAKARSCFLLCDFFVGKNDTANVRKWLLEGKAFSHQNLYLSALSDYYEGCYYLHFNPVKASQLLMKADTVLSKFSSKDAYLLRSKVWLKYSLTKEGSNDNEVTDILLYKCLPFGEQSGDTVSIAFYNLELGVILMNNEQYDKAEMYYNKTIQLLRGYKDVQIDLLRTYVCAAYNYVYAENYPYAKEMLDNAKKILLKNIEPYIQEYPDYYEAEGVYYLHLKQYQKTTQSFEEASKMAQQLNQPYQAQALTYRMYYPLMLQKKYEEAREIMLTLLNKTEFMKRIDNRLLVYQGIAESNSFLKNMQEAYQWQVKYSDLSDSLNKSRLKDDIGETEIKYRTSEKEKQILSLESQKTKAELTAKNSRLFNLLLGTICTLLLLAIIFAFIFYTNRKKTADRKLKELQQEQQLKVTQAMLEGEERERTRVARDLHDGLGGMLAGVKINLSGWVKNNYNIPHDNGLDKVIVQLDNSLGELRKIAGNMMPESLLKFGLETALADLCNFYSNDNLVVEFQPIDIKDDIPLPNQLNIYRIIQELISNAVKHAKADYIVLQCSQNDSLFLITVEDDGIGFDESVLKNKKGLGLNNIKNRVEFLKGKVDIHSALDKGTTINIELQVYAA